MQVKWLSRVRLLATPWTAAYQAPPSMGFSREESWSGMPCPPPGDLPNPGIKPVSLVSPALAGRFFTTTAAATKLLQSCLTLCDPWTVACQAPLSKGFSRQEHWSGLPFSSPGDLPNPGIEPTSLASPTLTGRFFSTSTTWEALL